MARNVIVEDPNTVVREINGITFAARRAIGSQKFGICALIETGSNDEEVHGTAHLLEHLVFAESENFKGNIMDVLKSLGGFSGSTSYDSTKYCCETWKGNEEEACLAVSDLVCRPVFSEKARHEEIDIVQAEWAMCEMKHDHQYKKTIYEAAFGDQAPQIVLGTFNSIPSITLDDVKKFY